MVDKIAKKSDEQIERDKQIAESIKILSENKDYIDSKQQKNEDFIKDNVNAFAEKNGNE